MSYMSIDEMLGGRTPGGSVQAQAVSHATVAPDVPYVMSGSTAILGQSVANWALVGLGILVALRVMAHLGATKSPV